MESNEDEQVNTTDDRQNKFFLRRNGQKVKCVICGGNHWPNKCPNKNKGRSNSSENKSDSTDTNENTDSDPPQENVVTETTNVTVNSDLTGWDQTVDYGGLMFCSLAYNSKFSHDKHTKIAHQVEYNHILEQSDGKINKLWILLDNQ